MKIGLLSWDDQCEEDHIHDFLEFVYLVEGEMTHFVNGIDEFSIKSFELLW